MATEMWWYRSLVHGKGSVWQRLVTSQWAKSQKVKQEVDKDSIPPSRNPIFSGLLQPIGFQP